MHKTEVYSWRLSRQLKAELEEAARAEQRSLAELLEQLARDWLARLGREGTETERQQRLHDAALPFIGALAGADPGRAESSRAEVKARLARRHGR